MKLASCKSALNPSVVCSTDRSKAVIPMLVLLFVALWFILRGDLLYVFPCVILFLCFSVLLVLRLPRLGKRELILVLFVRLFGLCLFRFVGFLFLLGSGKGCGLWLWHSLGFSLIFLLGYTFVWGPKLRHIKCGIQNHDLVYVCLAEGFEIFLLAPSLKIRYNGKVETMHSKSQFFNLCSI